MRTVKQASDNSGIPTSLIKAVIKQLGGTEDLMDVMNHGASGGFSGFTYYGDTVTFFKKYKKAIVKMVKEMASAIGESPENMVASFGCLKIDPNNEEGMHEIRHILDGKVKKGEYRPAEDEGLQIKNALAWFALEEVARTMCDE